MKTITENINFRRARNEDQPQIWEILQAAIIRRKKDGSQQWQQGYPNLETVENDILNNRGFVLAQDKKILVYGAIILNDEPAYEDIIGNWLTNEDFFVIHRVAVAEDVLGKGFVKEFFIKIEEFALQNQVYSLKVDTNFDNVAMLKILEKLEYQYCGKVYFRGSERLAFEKVLK